jgi:Peptidase family M28
MTLIAPSPIGAAGNRGLLVALAGIALLLAATLVAYRPTPPLGPNASLSAFSAYRATAILRDLVGNGVPHPIGSRANALLREAIVKRFSALGYATELQSGFACSDEGVCGNPVNIVARLGSSATLEGSAADGDAVLLAAHYDSVPAGPGASDDGAAVASLLEIARILAALPAPRHPIVLLVTDGEEAGLLGASLFVREHPLSRQIKAAVNLDARGTSGLSLMFETGTANTWLMRLFGAAISRPVSNSLYYVVYKQLENDTDFTVFKTAGYQGFNFAFVGNVGRYHTPLDSVANASASSIQQQGENALATVLGLANAPSLRPPVAESVFFDGFARVMIAWPAKFALPAALLSLGLLLVEAILLLRRGEVAGREVMWGAVGTICTLLLGLALCAGALALLIAVGKVPPLSRASWISQPLPMHLAATALAMLSAGCVGAWLARRAGFWGFWVAAALFGALLSVIGAVIMPGASFAPLLAAIAAGLGGLPFTASLVGTRARPRPRWTTGFAVLLPVAAIFAAVLPLLQFLYMALGSLAWPVSTLVLCLAASTLLPLLATASGRARQGVIATAAAIAVGGVAVTLFLPTYSADWPERINVEYWYDADTGQSHYLALCDSLRLPTAFAAAAHFDPAPRPRFTGSASLAFYAAAPTVALAAPELSVTSQSTAASQAAGSVTHFELRLRSPRGAPEALVVFPAGAHVADIGLATAAGTARARLGKLRSGATLLDLVGLPAAGVEFSVDTLGPAPVAVQVFDQSYELADVAEGRSLQRARPINATSSQDGDLTVVHRTVSLDPTAGR